MKTKKISLKLILLLFTLSVLSIYSQSQPFGNSIVLNGESDYVSVSDNSSLDQTSTISIEAWINPCKVDGTNMIASKQWCQYQFAYYLSVINGKLIWSWDNDGSCSGGSSSYHSVDTLIQENQWQHVAVVHTPTGVQLYYDGNLVSGSLVNGSYSSIKNSNESLKLGTYKLLSSELDNFFQGRMDEVRVWNTALSSDLIEARWNFELLGDEDDLVAYYNMNIDDMGQGVTVTNEAIATVGINNGTTVGTTISPFFLNNSIGLENLDLGEDTTSTSPIILDASLVGESFLWQDGSTNPVFIASETGTYWVEATIGSCSVIDSILVSVSSPDCSVFSCGKNKVLICHVPSGNPEGAHEICISSNAVSAHLSNHDDYCGSCNANAVEVVIGPNPINESLNISVNSLLVENEELVLILYNSTGNEIRRISLTTNEKLVINTTDLSRGLYFYKILNNNEIIQSGKILK